MLEQIADWFLKAAPKPAKTAAKPALNFVQKKTGGREGIEMKFAIIFQEAAEDFEKKCQTQEPKPSYHALFKAGDLTHTGMLGLLYNFLNRSGAEQLFFEQLMLSEAQFEKKILLKAFGWDEPQLQSERRLAAVQDFTLFLRDKLKKTPPFADLIRQNDTRLYSMETAGNTLKLVKAQEKMVETLDDILQTLKDGTQQEKMLEQTLVFDEEIQGLRLDETKLIGYLKGILDNTQRTAENTEHLKDILRVLEKLVGGQRSSLPKHLTPQPLAPEIFLGREDDLEQVHEKLFKGDNLLLLVNGRGGIGKTTFAAAYYYRYHEEYIHMAWVFAERSLLDALLLLAGKEALNLTFDDQLSNEQRLGQLLQAMGELDKPCLLVVDNANELTELEQYHPALKTCPNFHVLLTTRVTELKQTNMHPLSTLDKVKAKELFTTHYGANKAEEDKLLEQVLEAVGYNTLVIELLAKNLSNFNDGLESEYPLSTLLNDLSNKGLFGIESQSVKTLYQAQNLQMREETPEEILAAMYELNDLPGAERELLSVFSVLPAEAIPYDSIKTLLPDREQLNKPLLALAKKGWLEFDQQTKTFRTSPVIQEITRKKNEARLWEEVNPLLKELNEKLMYQPGIGHFTNATYEEATVWARYGAFAMEKLEGSMVRHLPEDSTLPILHERLGNYHNTTGNLLQARTHYERYAHWENLLLEKYPDNSTFKNGLAVSYEKLGETHTSLGNLQQALQFFNDETELFEQLHGDYPNNVSFKNGLALSYQWLGWHLETKMGEKEKAINCYRNSQKLLKELVSQFPAYKEFQNNLAWVENKLKD